MSNLPALPTISELAKNSVELKTEQKAVVSLLNEEPPKEWVKENSYANNAKYLPIDKVEYLLNSIFPCKYKIEITDKGVAFNAVYVTVRVHYIDLVSNEWRFHDGIGAKEIQVKSGSSPADLQNINKSAVAMAFPIAETEAIKDACHKFGRLFGSDLNRKDTALYESAEKLTKFERGHVKWQKAIEAIAKGDVTMEQSKAYYNITETGEAQLLEDIAKYKKDNGII